MECEVPRQHYALSGKSSACSEGLIYLPSANDEELCPFIQCLLSLLHGVKRGD